MNPVLDAMQFRHACKKFDPARKIPASELDEILECARLSPSSFGMEPWKFLVIQDQKLRQELRKGCWDQPQITDASDVIVLLATPSAVTPDSDYVKAKFGGRPLPPEAIDAYIERYKQHHIKEIQPHMSLYAWTSKQCYIALSNIMAAAAAVGIDSCPIEGFEKHAVEETLGLDTSQYEVAVVVTLGYRAGDQTPRIRRDKHQVIEYR